MVSSGENYVRMKVALFYLKGKSEDWADRACEDYAQKIQYFTKFERVAIKSKSLDRDNKLEKISAESEAILGKIQKSDAVILFDESGSQFKNSVEFSNKFISYYGGSNSRIVFIIGGPYGFSDEVKSRAVARWSLGSLTMNHHVAQVAALEQIYRAFTIWKGLPYHNP